MEIVMDVEDVTPMFCQSLNWVLHKHPGPAPVYLRLTNNEDVKLLRLNYHVDGCEDLGFALDVLTGAI